MAYWGSVFSIAKKLTPLLLRAAATATDVKKFLKIGKSSDDLNLRIQSVEKSLEKQTELNDQLNNQIDLFKKIIEGSQRYLLFLTVIVVLLFIVVVATLIAVLMS